MTLLHPGEMFPNLAVTPTDGAALKLPDDLIGMGDSGEFRTPVLTATPSSNTAATSMPY